MMTEQAATFSEFISIPELLGTDFAGPSWSNWKIVWKGALGEEMTAAEDELFHELAQRGPPPGRVREVWLAVGRRAGKDSVASALATYLAVCWRFPQALPQR